MIDFISDLWKLQFFYAFTDGNKSNVSTHTIVFLWCEYHQSVPGVLLYSQSNGYLIGLLKSNKVRITRNDCEGKCCRY